MITHDPFYAVGAWYEDFSQTTDDQVRDLLHRATVATTVAHKDDSFQTSEEYQDQ